MDWALRSAKPDPRYAYIAPLYVQAKDVAWGYLKRFASPIPGARFNEAELRADFPNGARVRLYGADNYDRMRGIYLDGVVMDEYADMPSAAWAEVIRPALSDREGWAVFIGTPKGRNEFFRLWQSARASEQWFSLMLRASETGILAQGELDDARAGMTTDQYEREFECSFDAAVPGAYYTRSIADMRAQGRFGRVAADPLMTYRAYWDIGGTGRKADATAIWVCQFISREIRVIDYYEAKGQPLATHIEWLRKRGYGAALMVLPHDGANAEKVYSVTYEGALRSAGFDVVTIPNQGTGAAMRRVEAARRVFGQIWANEDTTRPGFDALGAYHAKIDEARGVDLGPEHDWASHAADAFGLMCVHYEMDKPRPAYVDTYREGGGGSWMAA